MTTLREAALKALEALEMLTDSYDENAVGLEVDAITALRTALADHNEEVLEMVEPVPPKCVAIIEVFGKGWRFEYLSLPVGRHKLYVQEYSYTAPQPRREPLTDEQIKALRESSTGQKLPNMGSSIWQLLAVARDGDQQEWHWRNEMRVRIRKRPTGAYESWCVEIRKWYCLNWEIVDYFLGDDAEEKAAKYAKELVNPQIREIKP